MAPLTGHPFCLTGVAAGLTGGLEKNGGTLKLSQQISDLTLSLPLPVSDPAVSAISKHKRRG